MYHLPAYLALERWVLGRRVVVVRPASALGPRRLLAAGASQVLVVDATFPSEPGIQVRPGSGGLPLRDDSVDVVVCVEAFAGLDDDGRKTLLREASRVLRNDGFFAAWMTQPEVPVFGGEPDASGGLDFYALEDELSSFFGAVRMLAQMPWQGFSVAPVPDDEDGDAPEPRLSLREDLLEELPEASHYLGFGALSELPSDLASECLLVPVPGEAVFRALGNASDDLLDEIEGLREELSQRAAKAAAASERARELESQIASLQQLQEDTDSEELAGLRSALVDADARAEAALARQALLKDAVEHVEKERDAIRVELEEAQAQAKTDRARVEQQRRELAEAQNAREKQATQRDAEVRGREKELQGKLTAQERELRSRETDLAILTRATAEHDRAVARMTEQLTDARRQLEQSVAQVETLRGRLAEVEGERSELRRQVDVLVAEGDGARKLAARVEAELEVAHRRATEQAEKLANKIEEASRLAGEVTLFRQRLSDQERLLAKSRTRAEELSATVAQSAEKGRMLADVALDRDRLREELAGRSKQIDELEARLWEAREALQKERIDSVRGNAELERLREHTERSRDLEQKRADELQALSAEVRGLEVERAELRAMLKARDDRISQIRSDHEELAGKSVDAHAMRVELEHRGHQLSDARAQLERSRQRETQAVDAAQRREQQLAEAGRRLQALQRANDEQAALAAKLQSEIDVRAVEVEELQAGLVERQRQVEEQRNDARYRGQEMDALQQRLEEAAGIQQDLRGRLRAREQELEDLSSEREHTSHEVFKLRRELETAAQATEQLQDAMRGDADVDTAAWPPEAVAEVARLRREMSVLEEQAALASEASVGRSSVSEARTARLQLEVEVRAREQEYMLQQLDRAEQQIWEMTDATDRNAARFAASLAQLEKQKEKVEGLMDELDVTRSLLAAEQARSLEQERLLASERAKLARAGFSIESGFREAVTPGETTDEVFAELKNSGMVDLGAPSANSPSPGSSGEFELDEDLEKLTRDSVPASPLSAVPTTVDDRSDSKPHGGSWRPIPEPLPERARLVVETVDEDEWPEEA